MAKTRPIVPRDTSTHSSSEIKRRLAFLVYVLSVPIGAGLLIAGLARPQPTLIVAGVLALVLFAGLHRTRARWGMKALSDEIARNPFKPKRVPEDRK